jgi:pimeloyl-ACP methyl ester carboxylesterase
MRGFEGSARARKVVQAMLALVAAPVVIALAGVMLLLLWSRGEPERIIDGSGRPVAGSLSEKVFVEVNGVRQGMFIVSRDTRNPVLLLLHGGPGLPEFFLSERYPTGLEDDFTVVWWEQRGAGLSYRADIPPETMTIDQIVDDTIAVTHYLRDRFGEDKVYLLGHSGGTFFGILAAARAPELYHAYVGVAQMSFQLASEMLAYDYMLERFREAGDASMVRRLEGSPPTTTGPLPAGYLAVRDAAMHALGIGTTREMRSVVAGVFVPSWLSRSYTLTEKVNLWRGKAFSARLLRDAMFATDLTRSVTALDVPVYFLHGQHDHTVSYPGARSYLEALEAPVKGFYTFQHSAHSPLFEEPQRFRTILREDVLHGENALADR